MLSDKKAKSIQYYTFFLTFILVLGGLILLFYPRISSSIRPESRVKSWSTLKDSIETQHKVDPQAYWQFREFYNIGNFVNDSQGLGKEQVDTILLKINAPIDKTKIRLPFLIYTSPLLNSLDAFVTSPVIELILNQNNNTKFEYKDHNTAIIKLKSSYLLIFVLPISQMQKANGYFDYQDQKVKNMLLGKYWLNITAVKL